MPDRKDTPPKSDFLMEADLRRIWNFFTSLRLTVTCLAFGILLIWVGTVAQADEGLYQAQSRYFKQWIVWGATLWGHRIPLLLPGGYLLGTVLLVNLIAAHIKRFKFTRRQAGINLTHFGIILLLVGQLATDMLSRESHLRLKEGETKSYSEDSQRNELAFTHDAGNGREEVISIPQSIVAKGGTITHEKLPFAVQVSSYSPNADVVSPEDVVEQAGTITTAFATVDAKFASPEALVPLAESEQESPGRAGVWRKALTAVGEKDTANIVEAVKRVIAQPERAAKLCTELKTQFHTQMAAGFTRSTPAMRVAAERILKGEPVTADAFKPAANNGVGKSTFVVARPEAKDMDSRNLPAALIEIVPNGQNLGTWLVSSVLLHAQPFTIGKDEWHVALRGERIYHPFAIKMLKTTHDVYRGTDIPKNFQSRVRIENAATFENREVDIYMNNPLRYAGLTFYQYQMGRDEIDPKIPTSTLQVVRNPSWLTPYLGCLIVALGMVWQFMYHLVGFIAKRRTAATAAAL